MFKIGTVGKPINDVEVKIANDGEILIKGPNVMLGYYKDPEKTAEVIRDNYFYTGDKGVIDIDGFLKITGRKKEMFKTSGGKYIIPTILENGLKQSPFIEQVMVVGEGEKMPAALIQIQFDFVNNWLKEKESSEQCDLINSKAVIDKIQEEIDFYNKKMGKWEQIKKFKLTPDVWSIEAGHLTPTLKMKRAVIKERYKHFIQEIYENNI